MSLPTYSISGLNCSEEPELNYELKKLLDEDLPASEMRLIPGFFWQDPEAWARVHGDEDVRQPKSGGREP